MPNYYKTKEIAVEHIHKSLYRPYKLLLRGC
jgi:hypothetical protein